MFVCLLFLVSCASEGTKIDEHSIKAWTGEFSDEKLMSAIQFYEKNLEPHQKDSSSKLVVPLDGAISEYRIARISPVGEFFSEMNSYVDKIAESEYNELTNEITIDYSCLYPSSGVFKDPLWSFLIKTVTASGDEVWYYTRVRLVAQ